MEKVICYCNFRGKPTTATFDSDKFHPQLQSGARSERPKRKWHWWRWWIHTSRCPGQDNVLPRSSFEFAGIGRLVQSFIIRIIYFFAVPGFKQNSPVLPAEALMAFQTASSSTGPTTLTVPNINGHHSLSAQSSPGGSIRSAISPIQGMSGGTSLAE